MKTNIPYTSAGVLLRNEDNQILVIERRDGRGLGLPFGKKEREDGERPFDTAIRECLEETGIVPAVWDDPFVSEGRVCYQAVVAGRVENWTPSDEGRAFWVTGKTFLKEASHPEYAMELLDHFS